MVRFTKTGYHRYTFSMPETVCVCVCEGVYGHTALLLPGGCQEILETIVSVSCWDQRPGESRLRNVWD